MDKVVEGTFRGFMERLEEWESAPDRDPLNYRHSLGFFLSQGNLAWQDVPLDLVGKLSLQSSGFLDDVLTAFDVEKVVASLGSRGAAEYFLHMGQEFRSSLSMAALSRLPDRRGALQRWLLSTRELRLALLQDCYELAARESNAPWEWLLALLDFTELKSHPVV